MRTLEALEMFEDNLDDIIDAMKDNIAHNIAAINERNKILGDSWVAKDVTRLMIEQQEGELIARYNTAVRYRHAKENPETAGVTSHDIMRAKDYPLHELFPGKLIKSGKTYKGICPFHKEKTPSFIIKNNRFNCFGCNVYGDTIDFYRRLYGVSFQDAVKKLA